MLVSCFSVFIPIPLANAATTLGNNTSFTITYPLYAHRIYYIGPFTASSTGYISQINAGVWGEGSIIMALYSDNAGSPGTLLATTQEVGTTNTSAVNTFEGIYTQVTSGNAYWFAVLSSHGLYIGLGDSGSWTTRYQMSDYPYFVETASASSGSTSGLPVVYATVLSDPFTVSSVSASAIMNSYPTFSALWTTNQTLSHYIVQTNLTGTAVNETAKAFTSTWSNYTASWKLDELGTIEWKIYANTTLGLWADTGLQTTVISPAPYYYIFNGVYDENTAAYIGECNVTAYFDDGTEPDTFTVNSTSYYYYPKTQPLYFDYIIYPYANTTDTTINRQYWLEPDETSGSYTIFGNELGLVHIVFQIRALGGVGLSSYLEVQRIINGTYQTVEKRQVDANGIATMSLQPYTVYRLIAISDSSSYTFGNINTYTTAITLTLSALSFPNDVLMQYKYLRIWASRPTSTEIQVSYEDTNLQTVSVSYQIAFANGTVAYSATHTGENSFIDVWSAADPDTTYYLTANVSQSTFGYSTFAQVLLRDGASTSPIDLSFLGDWPIDATQLFWAFIVFIVFGVGSVLNAYIGGFAGVATAAVLVWLGWLQVPAGGVVAAFCVVCMVGIVYWKRRS